MSQRIQRIGLLSSLFLSFAVNAGGKNLGSEAFPQVPDDKLTPGTLCVTPTEHRYPEKIPYCHRNVDSEEKRMIIRTYDQQLGFRIQEMNRMDFKIDHRIPLCAGGSNEVKNLWPQHKSVYAETDPLEAPLCQLMSMGRLKQAEAIELIQGAKENPDTARQVYKDLMARMYSPR